MRTENITLPKGTVKRIHVNGHIIRKNGKQTAQEPVLTIKNRGYTFYGTDVIVRGEMKLSQNMSPLSCGARVYIETRDEVEIRVAAE